jgi:hypothetical protein
MRQAAGNAMTDEERQKLCATLRRMPGMLRHDCIRAADEIERLVAADVEYWKMIANRAYIDPKPLAQSDAERNIEKLEDDGWRLPVNAAALAQSNAGPREIDPTKVICPNCTHQFKAISVADQKRLRAQSDAKPVAWLLEDEDDPCLWDFTFSAYEAKKHAESNKKVRPMLEAPPRPDASAGVEVQEIATKYASRLHDCLSAAGFAAPREQWLAAHFRDAIAASRDANRSGE